MSAVYRLNDTLVRTLQDICDDSPVSRDIFDDDDHEHPKDSDGHRRGGWHSSPTSCIINEEDPKCASLSARASAVPPLFLRKRSPAGGMPEPLPYSLRDAFHLSLRQQQQTAQLKPAERLPHPAPKADALHKACCDPNVSVADIERLLRSDPSAASRSLVLKSLKPAYSPILRKVTKRVLRETYTFPLNLAIKYRASPRVIEMLVDAAPQVLTCPDGSLRETPLAVFLKYHPHNVSTFDKMLLDSPRAAALKDRHHNTLAHVGAREGISVEMMSHICILFPESLRERNFHGKTPIELAQQHTSPRNEAIASFLWDKQQLEVN